MGVDSFTGLPRLPAPSRRWRRASRHRIGPLRSLSEAAAHPILSGIRSGAIAGLAIVALVGLPVLLVLGVKSSAPVAYEPAAMPQTEARAWAEPPAGRAVVPIVTAIAEPARARSSDPPRRPTSEDRPALSVELIPVLDDESGTLSVEELPAPAVKSARPSRIPAAARVPKVP